MASTNSQGQTPQQQEAMRTAMDPAAGCTYCPHIMIGIGSIVLIIGIILSIMMGIYGAFEFPPVGPFALIIGIFLTLTGSMCLCQRKRVRAMQEAGVPIGYWGYMSYGHTRGMHHGGPMMGPGYGGPMGPPPMGGGGYPPPGAAPMGGYPMGAAAPPPGQYGAQYQQPGGYPQGQYGGQVGPYGGQPAGFTYSGEAGQPPAYDQANQFPPGPPKY